MHRLAGHRRRGERGVGLRFRHRCGGRIAAGLERRRMMHVGCPASELDLVRGMVVVLIAHRCLLGPSERQRPRMHRPARLIPAGRKGAETGDRFACEVRDRAGWSREMRRKSRGHGRFGHFPICLGGIFGRCRSRRKRAMVVERRLPVRAVGCMGKVIGTMMNYIPTSVSWYNHSRKWNHEPRPDGDITLPFMVDVHAGNSCVSGRGG